MIIDLNNKHTTKSNPNMVVFGKSTYTATTIPYYSQNGLGVWVRNALSIIL